MAADDSDPLATGTAGARPVPHAGRAAWVTTAAAATVAGLFVAAVALRLGAAEYCYRPRDPIFWVRRLALLAVGIAGMCAWDGCAPWRLPRRLAGPLPPGWAGPILAYGLAVGLASPLQRITVGPARAGHLLPLVATLFGMVLTHVLAEEAFFRGALAPALEELLGDRRLAIVVGALAYAGYHLTYYAFWVEAGPAPRIHDVGLIALFAGMPYTWLARHARTLRAPLLCHLAVQAAMMARSVVVRLG